MTPLRFQLLTIFSVAAATGQPRQHFEVAVIKPAPGCELAGRTGFLVRPGRLNMECVTVKSLIGGAYRMSGDPSHPVVRRVRIEGAASWVETERYSVVAKAEDGATPVAQMLGPMMQALLAERFALRVHLETREGPVYALTLAKSGLKSKPNVDGSCVPGDLLRPAAAGAKICDIRTLTGKTAITMHALGVEMGSLATALTGRTDRDIVDRTGLNGKFDFNLQFARDDSPGASGNAENPPSLFTALEEQLGLKLVAERGPLAYLIVDHVDRPTEN